MKRLILVFLTLTLTIISACKDDFQDGWDASKRGDYKTAFDKWKPLAEKGNDSAQNSLGVMYQNGRGGR